MAKALFNLPPRSSRPGDAALAQKASQRGRPADIKIKGGTGLLERIKTIVATVETNLGHLKDDLICIRDPDEFIDYFDEIVRMKYLAYDTETSGLNPILDKLAGLCLYVPGRKPAYAPMHHISYITNQEVDNQISDELAIQQLKRVIDGDVWVDMFNAKFDIRVTRHNLGIDLPVNWDGYIGARLLNENEGAGNNDLKTLHTKYCRNGIGESFTYSKLFDGIPFTLVPISAGYLYAANDGLDTNELCEFQREHLDPNNELCKLNELEGVSFVMNKIEMPLIPVVADMEDAGVGIDYEYADKLSKKYSELRDQSLKKFYEIVEMWEDDINAYRRQQGAACKLDDPINVGSATQLAILLYDIMKIPYPKLRASKRTAGAGNRGTGEPVLEKIDHPICKAILEYRGYVKLLSTYIDKMVKEVNPKTGKIHCSFNQLGTDTGRFSSNDPNMQNIPSRNKDIRKMFIPTEGHVMISADYSAQEPRLTAHMSQDKRMIQAYIDGKDLYCEIAAIAFGVSYEDCLEFRPDGTQNPEGKVRRNRAKAIVLGVCYGKGVPAIADDLGIEVKLAQEIYDTIMREFPGLEQFMIDSQNMAKEKGYVTTLFGRKRRLPNMRLPKYEFTYDGAIADNYDPLDFGEEEDSGPPPELVAKYTRLMDRSYGRRQKAETRIKAAAEGLKIKDNGGFIAEATRQCVNARIQGGAGDQIKIAMVKVAKDQELKDLGFRLILQVHDELIGEVPKENARAAAERFKAIMESAISDYLSIPSKCDTEITERWYGKELIFDD